MGRIISTRYSGPDDPIYSGGLKMSFQSRQKKPTQSDRKDSAEDIQEKSATGTGENDSSSIEQGKSKKPISKHLI